jgi:hypothetical protein
VTDPYDHTDAPVDPEHDALLGLHGTAGTFGGERSDPGFGADQIGAGLTTLSRASTDMVSYGARLDVLHALAKEDFPGYERHQTEYLDLAASIGQPNGLDGATVLDDVKASAQGDQALSDTATGQALPHEATAFVGQEICNTAKVWVDGKQATWIFSEFETDAPFETLVGWVDPRGWPQRSPMLFKRMDLIGGEITQLRGVGADQHWHGEFLEEVQLVDRLRTLLHCDFYAMPDRDEGAAVGMTYNLTFSVADQILVDRGFLLASDIGGGMHRAKALKIVGFEASSWDTVARFVCPLWTDFVRQAARGGTTTTPHEPTKVPPSPGGDDDGSPFPGAELLNQWVDCVGDAAKAYSNMAADVTNRATSGNYKVADLTRDAAQYWLQLARDWATAWSKGMELLEDVASGDQDFGLRPRADSGQATPTAAATAATSAAATPGVRAAAAATAAAAGATTQATAPAAAEEESTTIPIPRLDPAATVTCSDLVCIEAGNVTIAAGDVTVTRTTVSGSPAVRVAVAGGAGPAGLYLGTLTISGGGTLPIQFYVSNAVHESP